jgi:hypothetical protein
MNAEARVAASAGARVTAPRAAARVTVKSAGARVTARAPWLMAALAISLGGCGSGATDADASILLSIWNGSGLPADAPPPRPGVVELNWLDDSGFLIRSRAVAIAAGTDDFLGSVLIGARDADAGNRRAFARAWAGAGGKALSEGWASGQLVAGVRERPLSMMLLALPDGTVDPYDQDGDQVPDAVDNCPTLANPDQLPGDC